MNKVGVVPKMVRFTRHIISWNKPLFNSKLGIGPCKSPLKICFNWFDDFILIISVKNFFTPYSVSIKGLLAFGVSSIRMAFSLTKVEICLLPSYINSDSSITIWYLGVELLLFVKSKKTVSRLSK